MVPDSELTYQLLRRLYHQRDNETEDARVYIQFLQEALDCTIHTGTKIKYNGVAATLNHLRLDRTSCMETRFGFASGWTTQ